MIFDISDKYYQMAEEKKLNNFNKKIFGGFKKITYLCKRNKRFF